MIPRYPSLSFNSLEQYHNMLIEINIPPFKYINGDVSLSGDNHIFVIIVRIAVEYQGGKMIEQL